MKKLVILGNARVPWFRFAYEPIQGMYVLTEKIDSHVHKKTTSLHWLCFLKYLYEIVVSIYVICYLFNLSFFLFFKYSEYMRKASEPIFRNPSNNKLAGLIWKTNIAFTVLNNKNSKQALSTVGFAHQFTTARKNNIEGLTVRTEATCIQSVCMIIRRIA